MLCLVLGASGFIGTNLCLSLLMKGHTVRAFGRAKSLPDALRDCEWIEGDFNDPLSLSAAISGCDIVYHLVNSSTPASANIDKFSDLKSNVFSTLHLLDICRYSGVGRLIFVSSGGTVYGIPQIIPTPESALTLPITAYGISKLTIEKYLHLYEYLHQLDYRVLRVSNPYGPYQTAQKNQGVIAAFLRRALSGQPIEIWGDGMVIRDYIYIDDVVDALILAASHQGSGRIFNIGSGVGQSLNEIAEIILKSLNTSSEVIYKKARRVDVPVNILDSSLAARELGWKATTPLNEGLHSTIAWLQRFSFFN